MNLSISSTINYIKQGLQEIRIDKELFGICLAYYSK